MILNYLKLFSDLDILVDRDLSRFLIHEYLELLCSQQRLEPEFSYDFLFINKSNETKILMQGRI